MARYRKMVIKRQWWAVLLLLAVVILLGLGTRYFHDSLPEFLAAYAGTVLWGWAVFLLFALIFRKAKTWLPAICALVLSFGIEFSQMYHAPWIDALRANPVAELVFGSQFEWTDLICYAVGIFIALLIDLLYRSFLRVRQESNLNYVIRSKW